MASFFDDDNSRASSDNDADEDMEDLDGGDADITAEIGADAENDFDNQENYDEDDQDDTQEMDDSPSRALPRTSTHMPNGNNKDMSHVRSSGTPGDSRHPARGVAATPPGSHRATPSRTHAPFWRPTARPEALTAATYDIVPTIAAPQSTSINTVTATPDMKWVFSGGSDGWIRRFNWVDTVNSKTLLTVAQRQPFVDSVVKCGVLVGYWENEATKADGSAVQYSGEGPALSPVYSLAAQREALWLLSGTESGAINLQAVRHDEGKRITSLYKHTSAVSVMSLSADETSLLTGSWDKTIHDWDLNTGQVKRSFLGSGAQISAVEMRPVSNVPIPRDFSEIRPTNDTFSSDSADKQKSRGSLSNSVGDSAMRRPSEFAMGSPNDSLFGSNNSLFGDNDLANDDLGSTTGMNFDQEEDDISKALADGIRQEDEMQSAATKPDENIGSQEQANNQDGLTQADPSASAQNAVEQEQPTSQNIDSSEAAVAEDVKTESIAAAEPEEKTDDKDEQKEEPKSENQDEDAMQIDSQDAKEDPTIHEEPSEDQQAISENAEATSADEPTQMSLPHAEEMPESKAEPYANGTPTHDPLAISESTFLDSAMDGTLRIWDRRQPSPIARMAPRNTPPWCMHACWSHDGNYIYAGRRNGTVDEYSIHKGLHSPCRTLSFPSGSGAVSGVRAMPNGRHLICASYDILRLYDLKDSENTKKSTVPFLIVPGHRTGVVSQLYIDPTCTFLISTGGNRGWEGSSSEVLLGYEIGIGN